MDSPVASIDFIKFMNGVEIDLPSPGVTVIVGPNNAGKTALLRELAIHLGVDRQRNEPPMLIAQSIQMSATTDRKQALSWLRTFGHQLPTTSGSPSYTIRGVHTNEETFLANFPIPPTESAEATRQNPSIRSRHPRGTLRSSPNLFVFNADIESRSATPSATSLHNVLTDTPSAPLHYLYEEPDLESEVSKLAEKNFGSPLTLNRLGTQLELYVGSTTEDPHVDGLPNRKYIEDIRHMTTLSEQGHGVRSFMGLYLALKTRPYPVVLIDEPEAFLHPPQARSLGLEIARLSHENKAQAILATHSLDLLKGVLDYTPGASTVIRLTRKNDVNGISHLSTETIRNLWSDPLLRFSGVLDGLFYPLTVLCEGDPDCRFFAAVGSTMDAPPGSLHSSDVNFVPVGGKARFPVAAAALRAINVPCRVLGDFDMIRDRDQLVKLIEVAGGNASDIEADWRVGVKPISEVGVGVPIQTLLEKVTGILEDAGERLTPAVKKQISCELVTNDAWANVKRTGIVGVPPADVRLACERLIATLNRFGIFPSPYGELESLVPQVPGHGGAWLSQVLEDRYYESCEEARALLSYVLAPDAGINS